MKNYRLISISIVCTLLAAAPLALSAEAGDPVAGKSKNAMCIGCHGIGGYKTVFPEVYSVPKIGGQHAAYIVKALKDYKSGVRKNPIMAPMAANLTQRDIEDLSAYYSTQKGLVMKY